MFNSTYGAGKRAGLSSPTFKCQVDGTKVISRAYCPFSRWRFISSALWHEGYHSGSMIRLTGQKPLPLIHRIDPVTATLFIGLFIIFKVL